MNKKRVLVVYYSQTGQLSKVLHTMLSPLKDEPLVELEFINLVPKQPYPFPWPFLDFFNIFPETVHLDPPPIEHIQTQHPLDSYDLVILGYTSWFLKPAQPITAFLQSQEAKILLKDTPVITLVACRNMWLMAHQTVKKFLSQYQAKHIEHIALVDQGGIFAGFITTPRWMLTGKQDAFWGLPAAGIAEDVIQQTTRFGHRLHEHIVSNSQDAAKNGLTPHMFHDLNPMAFDPCTLISEKAATRSFWIWGKLIRAVGKFSKLLRSVLIYFYVVFLLALILTIVPVSVGIQKLLYKLHPNILKRKIANFQSLAK